MSIHVLEQFCSHNASESFCPFWTNKSVMCAQSFPLASSADSIWHRTRHCVKCTWELWKTSIYQPTNAHKISYKTHLKHFKTLRHISILSDHHQGALFLAKVILQYSQFNSYLETRCCGSISCCVGMCCVAVAFRPIAAIFRLLKFCSKSVIYIYIYICLYVTKQYIYDTLWAKL